jgi:Tfp pilus assembly protein PilN
VAPEFIPAVGLALAGGEFNLAREQLQAPPSRTGLALAGGAVALTLALAGVNLHVSLDRRRVALANLVQAEEQTLKTTLPHLTRIVSPLSQMRAELDKAKAGLGGLREDAPRPVLELLLTLERLGRAAGVELAEVSAEGGRVILDGRAPSFEALAAFQAVLAKEPGFGEVTRQAARQDGPKVVFKVRFRR